MCFLTYVEFSSSLHCPELAVCIGVLEAMLFLGDPAWVMKQLGASLQESSEEEHSDHLPDQELVVVFELQSLQLRYIYMFHSMFNCIHSCAAGRLQLLQISNIQLFN